MSKHLVAFVLASLCVACSGSTAPAPSGDTTGGPSSTGDSGAGGGGGTDNPETTGTDDAGGSGVKPGASEAGTATDGQAPSTPAKTYALLLVMSSQTTSVLGTTTSNSMTVSRIVGTQQGTTFAMKTHLCDLKVETDSASVKVTIPKAYVDSIPDADVPATVAPSGGTFNVTVPRFYQVSGAKLAKPDTDPLPTAPTDATVWDQDKDGHPGMTIGLQTPIGSGDLYVAQRTWYEMSGTATAIDSVNGSVTFGQEQKILDATNALLKNGSPSKPNPDATKSYFKLRAIDAALDCAGIIAQQATLFK